MQRNDSIHTEINQQETFIEESEMLMQNSNAYGKKLHPYQVLRTLPKDATPAQQDSAIQAAFQPAEIRYSSRPDTLRLPGQPIGKRASDVSLPQYYRESFFKTDSLFHPELNGGRMGMAGNPLPYRASNDDFVTGLLLILLVITILTVSRSLRFITTQAKNFLYQERKDSTEMKETINEVNYQFFLCMQAGVLLTLVFHNYSLEAIGETYVVSNYSLLGIYFAIMCSYFLISVGLRKWVNWTFFDAHQNSQAAVSKLFITAMEGIVLLPALLLYIYFGLTTSSLVIYAVAIVLFAKILSFYKAYRIFFQEKGRFLQIFLYFCTLELVPLAILWGSLMLVGNLLKVTY